MNREQKREQRQWRKETRAIDKKLKKDREQDTNIEMNYSPSENIEYVDDINNTGLFYTKDKSRKELVKLAETLAGAETEEDIDLRNRIIAGNARPEDIKRRQGLFMRKFNKQLNENLAPILEKQHKQELVDRMKSGDASAMSQYTTEGINKFGHQFMPILLTAATLPFGLGAFGQSINTLGLIPAIGAESASLGSSYGGYKLGEKLDDSFGTNWIAPVASLVGGAGGYRAGLVIGMKVVDYRTINQAFKSGQLKYGGPTAYTAYHQSSTPITKFKFPFKRWDVKTHGADPNGAFFTVGEPAGAGFLSERPYTAQFQIKVQKPLIQTGEIIGTTKNNLRNAIVKRARRDGADAVLFDGIADNQLQNQQILFATDNADIGYRGMIGTPFKQGNWQLAKGVRNPSFNGKAQIMWMGPTAGKTTYAKINPNVVDIDPLTKSIRKQVAKKLGLNFKDSNVSTSTEYQEAIVDMVNNWLKTPSNRGKTLVASTKHLLDPKYKIKFANEPFIPDFETFVARNQARGFRETPEQLRKWYDSILEIKPDIKIDNRFTSEILNGQ